MFRKLQQKWKVNGWRLVLILTTFAIGGSLTGYIGKKIMAFTGIETGILFILVYLVVVTLVWPLTVLLVSIPFGQFAFFKTYIAKMFSRMGGGKSSSVQLAVSSPAVTQQTVQLNNEDDNRMADEKSATITADTVKNKIAIFASGAGTNAQQIIKHFKNHQHISVALIVCNKPGAGVLNIAAVENIPVLLIEKEAFFKGGGYISQLKEKGITFIVLAGFLWKIPQLLIDAYPKRIINLHPALLPLYGGKGMYGENVHRAVVENGDQESGITIHYVDEHYDNGDIIFQTRCPVLPGDIPQTLAERIHALEHAHFPKVIEETLSIG